MSNEMQSNTPLIPEGVHFTEMQLSAVAEIQNISMGSAATAISNLLGSKVWITTPRVKISQYKDLSYPHLDPSVHVNVKYIKGVKGSNTMILKQTDVQLILNQLMGLPMVVTDDFVFDELNISAVSEVMNQMMGSAATALSEVLGIAIDISTPIATIIDKSTTPIKGEAPLEDYVVEVKFDLSIDNVINSEFVSILELSLARTLATSMLKGFDDPEDQEVNVEPEPPKPAAQPTPPPAAQPEQTAKPPQMPQPDPVYANPPSQNAYHPQPQGHGPYGSYEMPTGEQQMPHPQQYQYQQPMYQQPMYQPTPQYREPVNVKGIQLAQFDSFDSTPALTSGQNDNLRLLMDVPLNISVELGKSRKKVKEILEFSQGTIIELDRQAGAPVDIIVNGHLIARGDVVVIDDNFAVRVTEIVKSKFLDALGNKE